MGYSERCPPPISMPIKSLSPSPLVLSMSLPNNFNLPNLLFRLTRTFMGWLVNLIVEGVCSKHSGNHIVVPSFCLGTIQVLCQQRGGWVGWPIADVCWQGAWVGVAKCWREQKIRKKYPMKKSFLFLHRKKWTFFGIFLCGTFFMSIFFQTWPYLLEKRKNIYV